MPKIKETTKKRESKKIERKEKLKKEKPVRKAEIITPKPEKYLETVGKRKTAVARIRIFTRPAREYPGKAFLVNERSLESYFPTFELQQIAKAALEKMKCLDKFRISAIVKGGGLSAQAEAIRHGIARALVLFNPEFRKRLKKAGYLKRDPRMRERKKFGLKRARRAPQWQKR